MEIEVECLYEKCRVLISVLGIQGVSENDRSALLWMLEEYFGKLGEAIEKSQKK